MRWVHRVARGLVATCSTVAALSLHCSGNDGAPLAAAAGNAGSAGVQDASGPEDAWGDTSDAHPGFPSQAPAAPTALPPAAWNECAPMTLGRANHTATLLADGRVVVIGGETMGRTMLDSVEVYDPATDTWSDGPTLPEPRSNHLAALLGDGRILIAGGGRSAPIGVPAGAEMLTTAWFLDPATMSLSPAPALLTPRSHFVWARLGGGRVLVVGGGAGTHEHQGVCSGVPNCGEIGDSLASAEVFEPDKNAWTPAASMATARFVAAAAVLGSGKVLVVAGANDQQVSFASAEAYEPESDVWTPAGSLTQGDRLFHSAGLLADQRVLVAAGKKSNVTPLKTAELYDPAQQSWAAAASLSEMRTAAVLVPLAGAGAVLIGGFNQGTQKTLAVVERYAPDTDTWTLLEPMKRPRSGHTVTVLGDGSCVVVGGFSNIVETGSAERSVPAAGP